MYPLMSGAVLSTTCSQLARSGGSSSLPDPEFGPQTDHISYFWRHADPGLEYLYTLYSVDIGEWRVRAFRPLQTWPVASGLLLTAASPSLPSRLARPSSTVQQGTLHFQSGHGAAGIKSDRSSRFSFVLHFAEDVIRRLTPSDGWWVPGVECTNHFTITVLHFIHLKNVSWVCRLPHTHDPFPH